MPDGNEIRFRHDVLRHRRVRRYMTQQKLAAAADLSLGQVNRIERGEVTMPHFDTIRRLADALGIDKDDLVEYPPDT